MTHHVDNAGDRVEELLGILRSGPSRQVAEELVRQLMDLYGSGLARIVAILREHDPAVLGAIAADDLVKGLLLLHDLHPDDTDTRVRRALDALGSRFGTITFDGVAPDSTVRLRLSGAGCGSLAYQAVQVIERAVFNAAPEVTSILVNTETTMSNALLQIGFGPPPGWTGPGGSGWSVAS